MYEKWVDRLGFVGLSSGVFVFGYLQGTYPLSVQVEVAFVAFALGVVQAVIASVSFTGFITLSGLLFAVKYALGRSDALEDEPGTVTAIVPVYQDASVLHRSVESLLESTYEDLVVRIVCEPDDDASIARARELAERDRVDYLINEGEVGSKAGAINYALAETDSEFVAIFDADEVVHPAFVGAAVGRLDEYDVVQGRTVPEPRGLIESLAYYESVVLSYLGRRVLYLLTGFRMAASRAVVMERSVAESVGGYDPSMLTEDFDFAYRCYKGHVTVAEDLRHPSRIDAAHSARDWWGQRKRWMTGYAQVLHRLLFDALPPTGRRDVLSLGICASTVIGSLLCLSLFSKFVVLLLLGHGWLLFMPLAAVASVALGVRLLDYRTGIVDSVGWTWLLVPLVFPLYSLAGIKAMLEYLLSWDGSWYRVTKRA